MPRINRFARLADLTAVVLDLETTGLDVLRDRVVQIGALRVVDGRVRSKETFEALVNPTMPIPPASTAIHGIDDCAVQSAPLFADVHADLDAFVRDAVIVGQSVGFDLAVLLRETRRMGAQWRPPHFLDTKLLYAALDPDPRDRSLDELAEVFGISVAHRHTALDDARATAEIYVRLLPLLADAGIRTLGDAEAHSNAQTRILERQARDGWYDATSVRPAEAWIDGRDREALAPLDPFLYRQRLRHVMRAPVTFLSPHATVHEAAKRMDAEGETAVIVGDPAQQRVWGIVSARDVLRAVAQYEGASADRRVESVMSEAVASLPEDAFLYRGLALMQRRRIHHLVVTDGNDRAIGTVSADSLMGERAGQALRLGDEISVANDPGDLARAHAALPIVARELLNTGVEAVEIARVLSYELREMVGRAAVLAERLMANDGAGRPPAPYALFVLGSAGRGESLLAPEQDNALVYDSADPEGPSGTWFARFGEHVASILHDSGMSHCADGVSVQSLAWQGNLTLWTDRLRRWAQSPERAVTEHSDLLFDGHLAYGDLELAAEFRSLLYGELGGNQAFAEALAAPASAPEMAPEAEGRIDLKRTALFPLTCAARALAVRHGVDVTSTPERLAAVSAAGAVTPADRDRLDDIQFRLKGWLLRQQLDDFDSGRSPSKIVDVAEFPDLERDSLRSCLEQIRGLPAMIRTGLS